MTTRERREEYSSSSNVVRVLHPTTITTTTTLTSSGRPITPSQNATIDLDNNLDYLLEDLQSSVRRSKSKEMQYLAPSNTTTVVRERSTSPGGGESRRVYKTASYEYNSSTGGRGGFHNVHGIEDAASDVQQKINSLDSLLLDLKHEREHSIDRDNLTSNIGIDSGLIEPINNNSNVRKSTRTYTTHTTTNSGKQQHHPVNRELQYEPSPILNSSSTTSTLRQSRSRQRSPVYDHNIETKVTRDVSFESDPTIDNTNQQTSTINRSYNTNTYSSTKNDHHQVVPYTTDIVEVETSNLPDELNALPLSSDILPGPGTKVTTTIKTFTYEIPGDTQIATNKQFNYQNETYNTNTMRNVMYPERDIPSTTGPSGGVGGSQTTIYKNESYNTINNHHHRTDLSPLANDPRARSLSPLPPQQQQQQQPSHPHHHHPSEPPIINNTIIYKRETRDTSSNVYSPQEIRHPPPPLQQPHQYPPNNQSTYIYKHDVTNSNTTNVLPSPQQQQQQQQQPPQQMYPYDPNASPLPNHHHYPNNSGVGPQQPPKQTYLYKREITNTKNTVYGPPGSGPGDFPGDNSSPYLPQKKYLPPQSDHPPQPQQPNQSITYHNYTTNTTTRNIHNGGRPINPNDREPLLPFPTDGVDHNDGAGGAPPKRLDDLLATFGDTNGNGPYNHRQQPNDEPYVPRKEIQTALATGKEPPAEPKLPSKNIAGPPVYYPPGEMFTKSSEQAGWRAQGGYAKARGNYEYESESKSKSSSKSGGTMVPICLPLCCAMPCSIM